MSDRILRQDADGVVTLTLNRPEKRNALDMATFEALEALLDALSGDESIQCVVLRGAGKGFSAGADLGAVGTVSTHKPQYQQQVIDRLARLPVPTVAAIHGTCFTGGLELALACDFLIADESARFADTHGKWGFVGTWGITQRLPRRIGIPRAKRMMMTSRIIDAAEALAIGLIDALAPQGTLDTLLSDFVGEIVANSAHTNREVKRFLIDTEAMTMAEALAHELFHHPGKAADSAERVASFTGRK